MFAVLQLEISGSNLYGGTLSNANWVVNPEQDAVFRMYGGTISDADLGVYNFGNMYMYGGTIKRCRIGILGYAQTELYPDSLITDCTYGTDLGGSNRSAKLGGTIRNCDIGFIQRYFAGDRCGRKL